MTRRIVLIALCTLGALGSIDAQPNCSRTSVGIKPLTELGVERY